MCSEKDGTNVPTPSSSPVIPATAVNPPGEPPHPPKPNAFDAAFLSRLADRDEPAAAEEADWAGPWFLDRLPGEDVGLFRFGESTERGHQPFARFRQEPDALLALAVLTCRREAAYRLQPLPEGKGYAVQSRADWGEAVGWLAIFDDALVSGMSWVESLMRSPQALSFFLEACGRTVLERAGSILEERVTGTAG